MSLFTLSSNQIEFSDWIEKLNEKTNCWIKKWIIIENNRIYFFDHKPINESEMCRPKEVYLLDSLSLKFYRDFQVKTSNFSNKKSNVCVLSSCSSTLTISLKTEKLMNKLLEVITQHIEATNNSISIFKSDFIPSTQKKYNPNPNSNLNPNHNLSNKENKCINKPCKIQKTLQFSSSKKSSESSDKKEKTTMYATFRDGFMKKKADGVLITKPSQNKIGLKNYTKHSKTKSCGDYESFPIEKEKEKEKENKKKSSSYYTQTEAEDKTFKISSHKHIPCNHHQVAVVNTKEKLNDARQKQNINKSRNSNSVDNPITANKNMIAIAIDQLQTSITGKTAGCVNVLNTYQNEENSSLQKMINNMLQSAKKIKGKVTDSFINNLNNFNFEDSIHIDYNNNSIIEHSEEGNIHNIQNNNSNSKVDKHSILNSRKKQLNKIIKLSLPNTERLTGGERSNAGSSYYKPSKLNFEQSFIDDGVKCNPSKTFNFNLSQDEMSFDEKEYKEREGDKEGEGEINNINKSDNKFIQKKIKIISTKLENFEEYFFDSSIFKRLYKSLDLNKIDIGLIYNSVSKDYLKSQLLTEMIAIIAKTFLKESILKSLEIVLREKEMNKNYFILPTHQHSIEFCIVDIFNTFLGNNKESEEFFTKILPNYLSDIFKINFILNIKSQISIPNLFVLMQSHTKVYFNDNIDINFNNASPFVVQDIKYISPYYVNKWYFLALTGCVAASIVTKSNKSDSSSVILAANECNNGTTNVKRMKYMNFEMKDTFEQMLSMLKKSEKDSEELRINLIKNIYFHIFNKRNELALKLCDFYVQKFTESLFLNPIIYLVLSEIYNETYGLEFSRLFFEKAVNILQWQFPNQNNPLLIDLNYTFSLILMKQSVTVSSPDEDERNNNASQSQSRSQSQSEAYLKEIDELLEKSKELCDKFFDSENEKRVKIVLQSSLIKLTHNQFNMNDTSGNESFNVHIIIEEILKSLDFIHKQELFKEEAIYLNLFIDVIKSMSFVEDEIKIKFIKRLHEVKKLLKNKNY